jgi:VanZ family protein
LAVAAVAAVGVVLSSPFIGEIRAAIRAASPARFQIIVAAAVAAAVFVALLAAVIRIRDRRRWRFSVMVVSIAAAVLYARLVATGNAEVDVVEHVHFIEYGVLAWLFYRAWRPLDNGLSLVWPLLAGILVGIADEFVQWFIPGRVGEAHDIFLNAVAVMCGLCIAASVDPPAQLGAPIERATLRPLGYGVSVVVLAFAVFFQMVHLGHQIYDPEVGMFWSRYSAADLMAIAGDRAERWRTQPPLVLHRIAREDQYLSEGLWHVQARNLAWTAADPFTAWRENRILEMFFAPVLDTASYASPTPPRWPPEQRLQIATRVAADPGIYMSRAAPYPIYAWSPIAFWSGVAVVIAAIITAC